METLYIIITSLLLLSTLGILISLIRLIFFNKPTYMIAICSAILAVIVSIIIFTVYPISYFLNN